MKGLTDDKTNFKRGFWFHLSKAPQKKVFFQKCNGPRICFSAEEKGKRDVLKRHRWLRKQSDGISALKCTFPHIQTLSKTWRRQKNKRKPLLMQSFEVDGPQSRQRFLLGRKISLNTCNVQTAWWGPKNAKEWCFLVHGKVLSKSKGWHGERLTRANCECLRRFWGARAQLGVIKSFFALLWTYVVLCNWLGGRWIIRRNQILAWICKWWFGVTKGSRLKTLPVNKFWIVNERDLNF